MKTARLRRSPIATGHPENVLHGSEETHTPNSGAPAPNGRCAISAESAVSLRYLLLSAIFNKMGGERPSFLLTTDFRS
jgi:hypothetical protein